MNSPASLDWNIGDGSSLESFPSVALAVPDGSHADLGSPARRHARFMRGVISVGLALGGLLMLAMRVRRRTR